MMRRRGQMRGGWVGGAFLGACFFALLAGGLSWRSAPVLATEVGSPSAIGPDAACVGCHRAIYGAYEATPMARASGPAMDGLIEGGFTHEASGVQYRVFERQNNGGEKKSNAGERKNNSGERDGGGWLSYARPASAPGGYLNGEVKLEYFIGSNTRGRTYLFEREGYWFETPVNWYAKKRVWDMAPHYLNAREMPLTLPVDPNCLHCHASDVAQAMPGARNRFAGAPFARGGIGCGSCHGDAAEHVRTRGRAAVLNPAKLDAVRRDSVCLQCHLEGETAVYRQGHVLANYQPGESLFESVSYFVHQGETGPQGRATSQYEALLESACKRASGDRLTCTTCHDPHASETGATAAARVAFYRAKCLSCHTGAAFATEHHPEQPDCATCHMPRGASEDIAHEQVTDHRIQIPQVQTPQAGGLSKSSNAVALEAIGNEKAGDRELGLAYAQMAQHGERAERDTALTLLRKAEGNESPALADPELHTELGLLDQMSGDIPAADREYRAALAADPNNGTARGDLAVLFARSGDYGTAVRLWQRVFDADPAQTAAGYNLAMGQCRLGQKDDAETTLKRLLVFSPDDQKARTLAVAIAGGQRRCPDAEQ